jgi:hypothetical protein
MPAVSNLESVAERQEARHRNAGEAAYFRQWETQMAQVQNPEIRKLAEERKAKLQETFSSIRKLRSHQPSLVLDVSSEGSPDVLSNDLTIAVDAAKGLFAKAKTEGQDVRNPWTG